MYKNEDWDADYCNHRLRDTFLFFNGRLLRFAEAFNNGMGGGVTVRMYNSVARGAPRQHTEVMLSDIDLRTPRFGFMMYEGMDLIRAAFVARRPLREDWRQGIRARQLLLDSAMMREEDVFDNRRNLQNLEKSLRGEFPGVREALANIEEEYVSVPLSRNFAVNDECQLLFQDEGPVGIFRSPSHLELADKRKYLTQQIQKEIEVERIS